MVETLVAHDVIGRLMIQCARQPGLAQVPPEPGTWIEVHATGE